MGENEKPITDAYVVELNQDDIPKYKPLSSVTVSSMDTFEYEHSSKKMNAEPPKITLDEDGVTVSVKVWPQDWALLWWIFTDGHSRVLPARLRRMHAAKLQRIRKQEKRRKKEERHGRMRQTGKKAASD